MAHLIRHSQLSIHSGSHRSRGLDRLSLACVGHLQTRRSQTCTALNTVLPILLAQRNRTKLPTTESPTDTTGDNEPTVAYTVVDQQRSASPVPKRLHYGSLPHSNTPSLASIYGGSAQSLRVSSFQRKYGSARLFGTLNPTQRLSRRKACCCLIQQTTKETSRSSARLLCHTSQFARGNFTSSIQPSKDAGVPNLWDRALASLTDDDKKQLSLGHGVQQSQYSELLRAVEEKKLDCEKKQWVVYIHRSMEEMSIQDTLGRIHDSLENLKEVAGQGQRPSNYTPSPWADLKTLLHVSFVDNQTFGTTLGNIEAILGIIARYTKLEAGIADKNSACIEELSAGIVKLYGSVLRYLAEAIRYYSQKQIAKPSINDSSDSPDVDFCEPLLRFEKHEEKVRGLLWAVEDEDYTIDVGDVANVIHNNVEAYNSWSRRHVWELMSPTLAHQTLQKKDEYDAVPEFLERGEAQLLVLAMVAAFMSNRRIFETTKSNPAVLGIQFSVEDEKLKVEDLDPAEIYRKIRVQCTGIVRYMLDEGLEIDEATDRSWTAATLICLNELRDTATAVVQKSRGLLGLVGLFGRLTGKINLERLMMLPIRKLTDRVLDAMISHGASGNMLFLDRTTALDRAMKSPAMVRKFLEIGTDPNKENGQWWQPLVVASATGDAEVVKALIEGGARVNGNPEPQHHLCNPLHVAINQQHFEIARLLLDHGADINHKTRSGVTALLLAVSEAKLPSVEWLLDMGASIQGIWETQDKSVFDAVKTDDGSGPDIRRLLVRRGCFQVSLQRDNQAPRRASEAWKDDCLIMKAFNGDIRGVGSILEEPTRLATRHLGEALMVASALGHLDIVKILLSYGVEMDLTDVNGRTALHHAIMGEHIVVADLLTEHGASISIEDVSGSTPFDLAVGRGKKAMEFINKHLDSFVALTINRSPSPTETGPSGAPSQTGKGVRKAIRGFWNGFYRYVAWRTMEEDHWSIKIPKLPPQGSPPYAFFHEGGDEGEFCLHGFVDPAGTIWFIKLYGDEGWLFKGAWDAELEEIKGKWGRNRKLWFGSFNLIKMPSFLAGDD